MGKGDEDALLQPIPHASACVQNVKQHDLFRNVNFAAVSARKQPAPWDDVTLLQLQVLCICTRCYWTLVNQWLKGCLCR